MVEIPDPTAVIPAVKATVSRLLKDTTADVHVMVSDEDVDLGDVLAVDLASLVDGIEEAVTQPRFFDARTEVRRPVVEADNEESEESPVRVSQ